MYFNSDTVALVTGASRGIGRAVALDLALEGATVVVNYGSSAEEADRTVEQIKQTGGRAISLPANVAEEKEVTALFRKIRTELGRLDILVNNAGITKDGWLMMMSGGKWDEVINVNLRGCFLCTREAMKIMAHQKEGTIINIASTSGVAGQEGQLNYSASKGGIISFTKGLAREGAPYGIRTNAVAPGFIETDMVKRMDRARLNQYIEMIPLKRLGKPEEVAYLVSFLASPRAAYITGKVFTIDGGLITN
ncbi:MAG: 3-oxoacyl-[acyl-carrier-protein] reductase [Bacillota bacterium]